MRAKDELLAAIDREQALIGRLEREREEAQARVRSLQAQLSTPAEDVDGSVSLPPPSTAGQKVALFRGLFRGRDDVFAKLWVNPRTDRKGYAPDSFSSAPLSLQIAIFRAISRNNACGAFVRRPLPGRLLAIRTSP